MCRLAGLLLALALTLTGCGPAVVLPDLSNISEVLVLDASGRTTTTLQTPTAVARIVDFVKSHADGFRPPPAGVPVTGAGFVLVSARQVRMLFELAPTRFVCQTADGLLTRPASEQDADEFNALLSAP